LDERLQRVIGNSRKEGNLLLQGIEDKWKAVMCEWRIQEKEIHPENLLNEILGGNEDKTTTTGCLIFLKKE